MCELGLHRYAHALHIHTHQQTHQQTHTHTKKNQNSTKGVLGSEEDIDMWLANSLSRGDVPKLLRKAGGIRRVDGLESETGAVRVCVSLLLLLALVGVFLGVVAAGLAWLLLLLSSILSLPSSSPSSSYMSSSRSCPRLVASSGLHTAWKLFLSVSLAMSRSSGVKTPRCEKLKLMSVAYVCMYVCMYVCVCEAYIKDCSSSGISFAHFLRFLVELLDGLPLVFKASGRRAVEPVIGRLNRTVIQFFF